MIFYKRIIGQAKYIWVGTVKRKDNLFRDLSKVCREKEKLDILMHKKW